MVKGQRISSGLAPINHLRHKKSFQRTPNTPILFGHAYGIVAQKASPCSAPLNWALGAKQ